MVRLECNYNACSTSLTSSIKKSNSLMKRSVESEAGSGD